MAVRACVPVGRVWVGCAYHILHHRAAVGRWRRRARAAASAAMAGGEAAAARPAVSTSRLQLDRLLAGLDELSGTLPDLTGGGGWPGTRAGAPPEMGRKSGGGGYEEEADYALEKEEGRAGSVTGAGAGAPYHTRCDSKPFSYIR